MLRLLRLGSPEFIEGLSSNVFIAIAMQVNSQFAPTTSTPFVPVKVKQLQLMQSFGIKCSKLIIGSSYADHKYVLRDFGVDVFARYKKTSFTAHPCSLCIIQYFNRDTVRGDSGRGAAGQTDEACPGLDCFACR